MLGILFVYPLFVASCIAGFMRPYWGLMGFYAFVFLEPEWNWRWSIPRDSNFQKYIGACVILGFVLGGMRGNRLSGWLGYSVTALLGFLALAFISAQQTIDARLSAFYMDIISKVILMAIITIKVVDTPRKAWWLLWLIAITQGYNAFRINEQYFQDGYSLYAYIRSWGYKGDNNLYSIFTIPTMAASLALVIYSEKNWQRALSGFILVLQMHQLMLLESRGGMLGALFMFAVAVVLMPKNFYTIRSACIAAVLGAILAGPPVIEEFSSSFKAEGERDHSANSRLKLWAAGARITKDYPLLGVGPYAGQVMVPRYEPEYADQYVKGLHNLLFEVSTGCGIPAAILYFSFLVVPWFVVFRLYWRQRDSLEPYIGVICFALSIGIPGYLLASMFSSGALLESGYILIAGVAGVMRSYQSTSDLSRRTVLSSTFPRETLASRV